MLLNKGSNLWGQIFRYLISGGVAFVCDFGLLWALTHFGGVNYLVSTVFAYLVGLLITYLMSIFWIFDERKCESWVRELVVFSLIGFASLMLTWSLMWCFTEIVSLHYLLSKIVVTVIVFILNFVLKKIVLFSSTKP